MSALVQTAGLNHLTLRVTELERSVTFYCDVLGFTLRHRGRTDAYLGGGSRWLALLERPGRAPGEQSPGLDPFALTVEAGGFDTAGQRLNTADIPIHKGPLRRGSGPSVYLLDPDRLVVELHTSNLNERLKVWS
ncbi:VOC family protein [Deinococcus frigens]|uniref:VOC family protein n=1 Tax=Deinococcus frigens TaxID=249403 RepID=UPI00068DB016|nr:VOC family protein [Deinococcus frigens]